MTDLNLTLKFKHRILLCCQIWDIFSIYISTRELYEFAKMIILFRVGTPHQIYFENWMQWCMADSNHTPQLIIAHNYVVKKEAYLVYIAQLEVDQFTKIINMFSVGTPQPFIFKNWTQRCMTGLNFTPHLQYSTILCCQNRDIFIMDRPTRHELLHKNYQHVQGWNPTTIFLKIAKTIKQRKP